jgi:hypothetical protein
LFVFDASRYRAIALKRALYETGARLRAGCSSAHDPLTCGTIFNRPFATGRFGRAFFGCCDSSASAFFCHVLLSFFVCGWISRCHAGYGAIFSLTH